MGYCNGLISANIEPNCDSPIVGGIEQEGIIINRKDIDFSATTFDAARKNVITSLGVTKKGFKVIIPSNQPFSGTTTTMEAGTNRNTFTNNVGMVILDNDPDVCDQVIDSLATGEFVVILENKFKNTTKAKTPGDSAFQIYGYYQGLKATTLENDKYSEDTEGGWNVVLTETKAPKSAVFYFKENLNTTKESLKTILTDK